MDFETALGWNSYSDPNHRESICNYIDLLLAANGMAVPNRGKDLHGSDMSKMLLQSLHQKIESVEDLKCPADRRIEAFLYTYFDELNLTKPLRLPNNSLPLDRHGVSRELSLPANGDHFSNSLVDSYRVVNGVLHNPLNDRRTTKGTFHIVDGGLPIAGDKKVVPKIAFARLFQHAVLLPDEFADLPYLQGCPGSKSAFVSLMLRPLVCPEVPGLSSAKSMETRFFAPGGLVSNLDFVESIFGNAGSPFSLENDAGIDVEHWTGHTGAVILAPQLLKLTKKEVGLPSFDEATDRQRSDGMCWKDAAEIYNDGTPFKLTCRSKEGVVVTLIADNYFGYCKKEVKTQISYATNLYGNSEEEHAGGAIAFVSYSLGNEFAFNSHKYNQRTFADIADEYADQMDVHSDGYGVDKAFPNLIYVNENAVASLTLQQVSWEQDGAMKTIPLSPGKIYMGPSGYQVQMDKHGAAPSWRLVGTMGEGTFCHKPCTVSGGGKSEISKSIDDFMLYGPLFVVDLEKDFEAVQDIFDRDYSDRFRVDLPNRPTYPDLPSRKVLDPKRTLGSVIKLLTPSRDYSDGYNQWLESIPNHIYALVFIIKRFQDPDPNWNWRNHFNVDVVNGEPGHELKHDGRSLVGSYLRVGLLPDNSWRTFKLRQDFSPAKKIQTEDDISVSTVVPASHLKELPEWCQEAYGVKFVANCEYRLFQRPDEAINRGMDKQTEKDFSKNDSFISNFQPLDKKEVSAIVNEAVTFDQFTKPMRRTLKSLKNASVDYAVSSANPRIVNGKPTKNPRYLQKRPDLLDPLGDYASRVGMKFYRGQPKERPLYVPVLSVLAGRRNNPADRSTGVRALAVYNPMHYQQLPELFMDFISSLTGKSPSTTGAGSEGAMTKGPFNMLRPTADLNGALASYILTNLHGFSTPAGHIGPNFQVDHDISLVMPEIWCRLMPEERDPNWMIENELLEKVDDFEHGGKTILASRLGYRITRKFLRMFFGRVFDNPTKVFDEGILKPETQNLDEFADGIEHICEAHVRVATRYIEDGSIHSACPPLKSLLHIMAYGDHNGLTVNDSEFREMFTLESLLKSDWYAARLREKQSRDIALWSRHIAYVSETSKRLKDRKHISVDLADRLEIAEREFSRVKDANYLDWLMGTIGAEPNL